MPPINTFVEIGLGSGYDSFVNVVVGKYRKEYVKKSEKHFVSRNSCMAWSDGYKWIFKKIILTKKKTLNQYNYQLVEFSFVFLDNMIFK